MSACILHGTYGIECGPECRRLTRVAGTSENATESDTLDAACVVAAKMRGYPWLCGVLQGSIESRWTAARVIAFLRDECPTPPGAPS